MLFLGLEYLLKVLTHSCHLLHCSRIVAVCNNRTVCCRCEAMEEMRYQMSINRQNQNKRLTWTSKGHQRTVKKPLVSIWLTMIWLHFYQMQTASTQRSKMQFAVLVFTSILPWSPPDVGKLITNAELDPLFPCMHACVTEIQCTRCIKQYSMILIRDMVKL